MSEPKLKRNLSFVSMVALASGAVIGGWLAEANGSIAVNSENVSPIGIKSIASNGKMIAAPAPVTENQ